MLILPVIAFLSVGYSKFIYNPDNYSKVVEMAGHKVYEPTYLTYDLFQTFPFDLNDDGKKLTVNVEYHPSSFITDNVFLSVYVSQVGVGRVASLIPVNADVDFYEGKEFVDITIAKAGEAYIDTSYSKELSKEVKRIQFISQDGVHVQLEVDNTSITNDELVKMANSMKSR